MTPITNLASGARKSVGQPRESLGSSGRRSLSGEAVAGDGEVAAPGILSFSGTLSVELPGVEHLSQWESWRGESGNSGGLVYQSGCPGGPAGN